VSVREPLRVAVVGAECTGKTSLCAAIAQAQRGLWLPEVLREFCDANGRTPLAREQRSLMQAQLRREAEGVARARADGTRWVISDSTPLATALYSVQLFDDASLLPQAIEHQRGYALTLLADVDPPWVADGIQRDGPAARAQFHAALVGTLREHAIAFVTVSGDAHARLRCALDAMRALESVV
jgi:nicotinamide riboside kinase